MTTAEKLGRDGHRLLRAGAFILLLGLLMGLAVPRFAVPRLGLATHLLGITQGILLMVLGLVWPRLQIGSGLSTLGSTLAIYGCVAACSANFLGAIWGAGSSLMPIAAGGAMGSTLQEGTIRGLLVSAAISLITAAIVLSWGLRERGSERPKA